MNLLIFHIQLHFGIGTSRQNKFCKNCPQWGLNSQPPDHQSDALPDELSHYLVVGVIH